MFWRILSSLIGTSSRREEYSISRILICPLVAARSEAEGEGTKVRARVWLGCGEDCASGSWAQSGKAMIRAKIQGKATPHGLKIGRLSTPVVMPDFFTVKCVNSYQ
jgi:hypothetical protein